MMFLAQMGAGLRDPSVILALAIVIVLALGLHEFSHAKFADMAGDPTPRYYGRVTLNLFNHFDPIGTIMIIFTIMTGFGIGWGKPVPMDPSKMKNPRWDHFVAVLAGPFSNLLQAIVFAMLFRVLAQGGSPLMQNTFVYALLSFGLTTNLALCFFNLLPLGPLDGMWILGTFLPEKARFQWTRWNLTIGQFVFLAVIILGQMSNLSIISLWIVPPIRFMMRLLLGQEIL
ncbi:MAG TPA: site-2 protease family protein [Fimbriimonas sp.]